MTITDTFTTIDRHMVALQRTDPETYDAVLWACYASTRPLAPNEDPDDLPAADVVMADAGLPNEVTVTDVIAWDRVRSEFEWITERDGPFAPTYVLEVA